MIINNRTKMKVVTKTSCVEFSPQDCRRTFATIAEAVNLPLTMIKRLMNHVTTNDVTGGYIVTEEETTRAAINKIATYITAKVSDDGKVIHLNMARNGDKSYYSHTSYTCIPININEAIIMSRQAAIRLDDDIYTRLQELASKTGRTATFYMREAIETHIEDLEDIYLAEQTLDQVKSGKQRTFSLNEVERELGLED